MSTRTSDQNYIRFKAVYYWSDSDNTFYAYVPGFDNVFTDGQSVEEFESNLIDIMTLTLCDFEEEGEEFKKHFDDNKAFSRLKDDEKFISISFFYPYEKAKIREVYKNKTLTLPVWLDMLAKEKNINFSRVLQESLKKELKIK